MILTNYLPNARKIVVDDASKTTVQYVGGSDATATLFRRGILTDGGKTESIGSLTQSLAYEIADALESLSYDPVVEIVPTFPSSESEKLVVAPDALRLDRVARTAFAESRVFKIVYYKRLVDYDPDSCFEVVEALAKFLAATSYRIGEREFVPAEVEVDLVDPDQLFQNFVYCGSVAVTLATGRAAMKGSD